MPIYAGGRSDLAFGVDKRFRAYTYNSISVFNIRGNGTPQLSMENAGSSFLVNGQISSNTLKLSNGAGAGLVLTSDATGNASWQTAAAGNSWSIAGNNVLSVQNLGTTSNFDLPIITNNTEKARFFTNGNVSIGTTTSTERLSVNGNIIAPTGQSIYVGGRSDLGVDGSRFHQTGGGTYFDNKGLGNIFFRADNSLGATTRVTISGTNGNVGIGTTTPSELLDVNGKTKTSSIQVSSGGTASDFLVKSDANGNVGFKKGNNGLGLNFIICVAVTADFPSTGGGTALVDKAMLGEIRLFAGNNPPNGWLFCHGQSLLISSNSALFTLLQTNYGGNGISNFNLPDLRGAVPVGVGTTGSGPSWQIGERSN